MSLIVLKAAQSSAIPSAGISYEISPGPSPNLLAKTASAVSAGLHKSGVGWVAVLVVHISRLGGIEAYKGPTLPHAQLPPTSKRLLPSALCCGIMT